MKVQHVSGDSTMLKSINKTTLLALIKNEAPISRAELAKRTKLTRATVSALVEELIAEHRVAESGIGHSSGGRKPVMLEFNRQAGFIFGFDLRPTELALIVTDWGGKHIAKRSFEYTDSTDAGRTMKQVADIVRDECGRLPASPLGLIGIGIGIHGFVEYPSSRILFQPFFGWRNIEWKRQLEEELGVPVVIDNEANLAALGELEAGVACRRDNIVYLSVGAGIGGGLIMGGDIYRGRHGYAGEVGHTTIERDGLPCICGNRGCWEMYASERALAERLQLPYKPGITERIARMLESGDDRAGQAIAEVGRCLGTGIGNLVHTLNPEMVVIGYPIARQSKWLQPYIEQAMQSRFPYLHKESVEIRYSGLQDEACAIGASAAVVRQLLRIL